MTERMLGAANTVDSKKDSTQSARPEIGWFTQTAYGFGSVAYGVKDHGFNYFLLIFYSQVVGIDARLVGLAITLALVVDAISDPIVGYWSDNLSSRWGRRHPFMYASALPVAASYFLLWNPPEGWSDARIFWYLLLLAISIRSFITLYETPSSALGFELTDDYDKRSSLISFRFFFGWFGGNIMSVLMFMFLFPAMITAVYSNGQFNPESYRLYGLIASGMIFAGIMISAIGTHRFIPSLRKPPAKQAKSLKTIFIEIFETLSDKNFFALFIAALFGAIATGLTTALAFYFTTYFWGFTAQETGWITVGVFVSAIIGSTIAPIVTRTLGKKRGAVIIGLIAFIGSPTPIVLRLIGVMPSNDDPATFWIVFLTNMIDTGLIICYQILVTSMMADMVEQSELKTSRRSEGVFASSSTFVRKMVQGVGLMTATIVLTLAQFPDGAAPDEVPADALFRLGLYYVPILLSIWLTMILCISFYKIDRAGHQETLLKLKARQANE